MAEFDPEQPSPAPSRFFDSSAGAGYGISGNWGDVKTTMIYTQLLARGPSGSAA